MRVMDEPIETLHIYVVPERGKQPYTLLPLFTAFLCLVAMAGFTVYSALHPVYETLKLPAHFFPLTFKATEPVIPTGIKTYRAITAHGTLTITNGSVIAQTLPAGMIFTGQDGVEVVMDVAVFVPAGSATGYGIAYVAAHPILSGRKGNIALLDINSVEGSSIYIRNLRPFTGGQDAWSVMFATAQDKQAALEQARAYLLSEKIRIKALPGACQEIIAYDKALKLTWNCLFAAYPPIPGIISVKIEGKMLLVKAAYTPRSRPFPGK